MSTGNFSREVFMSHICIRSVRRTLLLALGVIATALAIGGCAQEVGTQSEPSAQMTVGTPASGVELRDEADNVLDPEPGIAEETSAMSVPDEEDGSLEKPGLSDEEGPSDGEASDDVQAKACVYSNLPGGSWRKSCRYVYRLCDGAVCAQCYTKSGALPSYAYCLYKSTCKTWCGWNDNGRLRCGNC
jgi:hypothetical protein